MAYDFATLHKHYDQVIHIVSDDVKSIKTGRAKPSMVEDLKVEAYGGMMSMKEVASITAPDPHMLTITPWDQSVLNGIQKAIMSAPLGLNPIADGKMIRISIPALTGEKRQELIKQVAQKLESGRQMLRNERVEIKKKIEAQKGEANISEDDIKQDIVKLEEYTKEYMSKLDELGKAKEIELTTI